VDALVSLAEQERQLLAELDGLPDAPARFAWLVERARRGPALPPECRTEAHRVPGCLARLWVVPEFREGRCHFRSESDSLVVKAVAGLLCDFYSARSPAEIVAHPPGFLGSLGLAHLLTASRRTGLLRAWDFIRAFAGSHLPAQP
jgi:cysteine desulfuration protein SufE